MTENIWKLVEAKQTGGQILDNSLLKNRWIDQNCENKCLQCQIYHFLLWIIIYHSVHIWFPKMLSNFNSWIIMKRKDSSSTFNATEPLWKGWYSSSTFISSLVICHLIFVQYVFFLIQKKSPFLTTSKVNLLYYHHCTWEGKVWFTFELSSYYNNEKSTFIQLLLSMPKLLNAEGKN